MKLNTLFGFLFVYLINWIGILNGANFQEEPWPASEQISLTSAEDPDVHEFNFGQYLKVGSPTPGVFGISTISSPFTTKANGLLEYNGWGYEEFPAKGEIKLVERNTAGNWIVHFEPFPFVNGEDYFHWNGQYQNYAKDANFTFNFQISDADQDPMILVTDTRSWPNKKTFAGKTRLAPSVVYDPPNFFENQNLVMEFILFDPEPELEDDFSFAPTLEIIESAVNPSPFFLDPEVKSNTWSDTSEDGLNGQQYTYFLRKKNPDFPLDFETTDVKQWEVDLKLTDPKSQTYQAGKTFPLVVNLKDIEEPPAFVGSFDSTNAELDKTGDNTYSIEFAEDELIELDLNFRVYSDGDHSKEEGLPVPVYQLKYDLSFPKYNDVVPTDSPPEEVFILRMDEDGNWPADELLVNPAENVNHDTIATIIPLTRSADVSGRAPGAGQYPARPDGDKDDIFLDSGEEIRLLIRVTEEDYFTLPSNPMQFKVSAKDKAQAVLFTVNLSINNDFQDPITDPEHDALLQGESVIFLENDPDNNTSFVFDFNPVDADSYPNHELRPDYNASESGNPTNGGSIFYLLGGDDAGLFTVDENGSVFFKTPPDYESPLSKAAQNSSSNSSPEVRNTYYLDVTIHDSPLDLDAEVPDNTTEETYKLIVKVYDGQDLPYRKSLKTTYSIRTLENQDWNFDGEDEDGVPFRNTINLSVFDDDVGSQIWWKTIKQPTIAEKIEGDLLISGGSGNSPDTFIYRPNPFSYGEDNFTIAYTDDNETFFEILFLVSVANDADPPKLGYKKDGVNDVFFTNFSAVDPVVNDQFTFEIEVPENTPFSLALPFSDSIDQQHISSVVKTGRDQNQFTISEPYQIEKYLDANPYLWWVDLNWSAEMLPDFEELPNDGVYKVSLVPRDEGDDTSSEEYSFEFVITDVDEAPVIYPRPENIAQPYEANETAVYGIHAIDPENPDDNSTYYFWSITQDEKEFFVLRDADNPERLGKVNLLAKNVDLVFEQLPNFEDPLKNDFNVTIAVEQVEQSEDDEDTELRSSSQYHIQVKGNNDPPVLNPNAQSLSIDEIIDKSLTGPYSGANSGDQESSWFLDNLFTDEDEDALAYYIELEPGHEGKPSLQDHLFIQNKQLFFSSSKAPDHEMFENGLGQVMIRAFDGRSSIYELLTISINDLNDPPEHNDTIQVPDSDDFLEGQPVSIILNNFIKEVDEGGEDLSKLIITAGDIFDNRGEIVEGASAQILDTNIDGLRELIFNPPTHGSGEFFINLSITDLEITQEAVVVIKIIDVQEPPVVDMDVNFFEENPEINELYDKSDDGQNFTFFHKEGQMVIARFNADDTFDQSPKAYQFEWKINPSPDSKFFELRVNDEGGRDLAWNLDENEFLYGLPDYEKMQEDPSFEIRLSVKEKLSQGGDVVDGMTREVKVTVEVVPVPNKAPVFVPTDPSKYDREFEEEQENLLVDSFEALDPDEAEGVSISYEMLKELDYTEFELQSGPNGSQFDLIFNGSPDYETGGDNIYFVKLRASEIFDPEYVDPDLEPKFTDQLIKIRVTNITEKPEFITPPYFSIDEQTDKTFSVEVTTRDQNKNLVVQLNPNLSGGDNRHFVEGEVENTFQFVFPPDYENPDDNDTDNIYLMALRAGPIDPDTGAPLEVWTYQTYRVEVEDQKLEFYVKDDPLRDFTKLEINENEKFVIDIDHFDEESPEIFPDFLFVSPVEGTHYFSNSKNYSSVSDVLTSSNLVKDSENLSKNHLKALAGDIRNYGANDYVVMTKGALAIEYYQNDGLGNFTLNENISKRVSDNFTGRPVAGELIDLNTDGRLDLIVASTYNGESKLQVFLNSGEEQRFELPILVPLGNPSVQNETSLTSSISSIAVGDYDNDLDVDIAIAFPDIEQVRWYSNEGNASFAFEGSIKDIGAPRLLESFSFAGKGFRGSPDVDVSGMGLVFKDLLVGSDKGIYWAVYDEIKKGFSVQEINHSSFDLDDYLMAMRVVDIDGGSPDIIYSTNNDKHMYALGVEGEDKFSEPKEIIINGLDLDSFDISVVEFMALSAPLSTNILLLGDDSRPYVHLIEIGADSSPFFEKVKTLSVSEKVGGVQSLQVVDLDRKSDVIVYGFDEASDPEMVKFFDSDRFAMSGMLYFSELPDADLKKLNQYEVFIKASKKLAHGDPEQESSPKVLKISLNDLDEPPVLQDLPGSIDGILYHKENFQDVALVDGGNPESVSYVGEEIYFSTVPEDDQYFSIDRETGLLFFKQAPDFESDQVNYEITILVEEGNTSAIPKYNVEKHTDQRTYKIEVIDGPEYPNFYPISKFAELEPIKDIQNPFGTKKEINTSVVEDEIKVFFLDELNVSDPNDNQWIQNLSITEAPGHGYASYRYQGDDSMSLTFENESKAKEALKTAELRYFPDANYSGADEFIISATSTSGLPTFLKIVVRVESVNDAPAFSSSLPSVIQLQERNEEVIRLIGEDADTLDKETLKFSLRSEDKKTFRIDENNVVRFIDPADSDYEKSKSYTFEVILTSGHSGESLQATKSFVVNLTNIDDEPPRSEYLDQTEILSFDEEKRSIVELDFDDPDVPGSPFVRAEILNVDDYNLFELTDAGLLQTVALDGLDFETDKSLYKISIFVEDGADQNKTYNLQLLLDDVDENPPVFTSGANIASHLAIIPENQYFVYEVNATDLETENLVYGMTEGLDSEYFEFNANTRTLSFKTPPDYEALVTDLGVQPEYRVSLSVSDGTNSVSQTVTIQVTDDNDLPYLKINEYTLLEDALRFEATLDIEDQDGDLVSASLHGGPLHGSLQMDVLNFIYIPDPDFFGEDRVEVLLDDGKESTVVEFTLFVEPQNDRPVAVDDTIYFYQKNRKFNPYIGFNVLKNDHADVDAKEEEVNYRVEPAQAKTVNGVTIITNDEMPGFFGYYPPAGFMGEDSFQYRLIDQGLEDIGTVRIWVSTSAEVPEWTNLMHFGSYFRELYGTRQNWIYHHDMGWIYVNQPDQIINSTWMWREYLGWFWTGDLYFNWVYSDTFKKWMHWEGGISQNKDWFVRDENNNIYDQAYFIQKIREAEEKAAQEKREAELREQRERELAAKNKVRDEIIALLPSLNAVSNYVRNSSYFTTTQKSTIIKELALAKRSSTLNGIFDYSFPY